MSNVLTDNLHKISKDYEKIFLLTGGKSYYVLDKNFNITSSLSKHADVKRCNDFCTNPTSSEADTVYDIFKQYGADVIVAVGGGSVMDLGKLVKYRAIQNGYLGDINLIVIPTTPGTGSEYTKFAVEYDDNDNKSSVEYGDYLQPNKIIDFRASYAFMPRLQRIASCCDMLAHSIESTWTPQYAESMLKFNKIDLHPLSLFIDFTEISQSLIDLSEASGKRINTTKTSVSHALSYQITKTYDIPHGIAAALTLPFFIRSFGFDVVPIVDSSDLETFLLDNNVYNMLPDFSDYKQFKAEILDHVNQERFANCIYAISDIDEIGNDLYDYLCMMKKACNVFDDCNILEEDLYIADGVITIKNVQATKHVGDTYVIFEYPNIKHIVGSEYGYRRIKHKSDNRIAGVN